jgi:hypothetical protein
VESTPISWQERILQSVPSGIDLHQLERFLKLSPTERLEEMRQLLENAEALRRGDELSGDPRSAH